MGKGTSPYTAERLLELVGTKGKKPLSEDAFLKGVENVEGNVNHQDKYGNTLLHWAVVFKCEGAISSLLEKGANPHIENNGKKTPFHLSQEKLQGAKTDELFGKYRNRDYSSQNEISYRSAVKPSKFQADLNSGDKKATSFATKVSESGVKEITV